MTIKIEKNIPMPARQHFPFCEMEVGDSFLAPFAADGKCGAAYRARAKAEKETGLKFRGRRDEGGIRFWRVA